MKFGGQVPPTVIGQSQAAMAAWHDFLDQSSAEFPGPSTGDQGGRIWSLCCKGGKGTSSAGATLFFLGSVGDSQCSGRWISCRPSSPTFACDYHHIFDQRTRRGRNGQVSFFWIWESDQSLLYFHPPVRSLANDLRATTPSRLLASVAQQQLAGVIDHSGIATQSRDLQQGQPWGI